VRHLMRVQEQLLETLEALRVSREDILQALELDARDRADIFRIALLVYRSHASIVCVDHLIVNTDCHLCLVLFLEESVQGRLTAIGEHVAIVDNPHSRTRLVDRIDLLDELMECVHGDMLS
jgi:hypothetical protein